MEKPVTVVDLGGLRRHFPSTFQFSIQTTGRTGHFKLGYKSFAAVVALQGDAIFAL